ncbi:MAG TPA: hypothetical protein VN642_04330 [Dongiaceae bacterium]|nr:hypothetical protein [Dongiaceae bacterium]
MRSRINGVFVVLLLALSALVWSGCSKKPEPSGKDAGKAQSQYSSKGVSKAQSQYSSKVVIKSKLQPSDEEILKAIDDAGIMKRDDGSLIVIPPAKVVEKGKQNINGAWPVKVKFTLKYKNKKGKTSPPAETTTSFRIFEERDNAGKSVWKAQLGT